MTQRAASDDGRPATLKEAADEFALELTQTVRAVAPDAAPFAAVGMADPERNVRLYVHQRPGTGITLKVRDRPLLRLTVEYYCTWDHMQHYLAVDESKIAVAATVSPNEPLLRYEFVREPTSPGMPTGHLHVHAHRDAATFVMMAAGRESTRAKRRARGVERGETMPKLADLHFVVGGNRFRPCLEDVLEMLIHEFGVHAPQDAARALADGRMKWRRTQLKASVRDSPAAAREALERLGYTVTWAADGPEPPERPTRLGAL